MKKSRETFKMYEGQIKTMNSKTQELQKNKKELAGAKKKGKGETKLAELSQ